MLTSAKKNQHSTLLLPQADYSHAGFQFNGRKELFFSDALTKFFWNPVEAKGELLNLNDKVVRKRGKAGGSDKLGK